MKNSNGHNHLVRWYCLLLLLVPLTCFSGEVHLDATFGDQGKISGSGFSVAGRGYGVVGQYDGKILIAGSQEVNGQRDFSLVRLNTDGSRDQYFGLNGRVMTAIGAYDDEALAVAVLRDERIVLAGYSDSGQDRDFALACYLPDGTLDQQFGRQGIVVTQIGNKHDEITSVFIGDDDSIYVSGVAEGTSGQVLVAAKYASDGLLDSSFGEGGVSLIGVGDSAIAQGGVRLENGSLIISGSYVEDGVSSVLLVGLEEDGSLNTAFGDQGVSAGAEAISSEGYRVAVDDSGLIYVASAIRKEDQYDAALFRFLEDGSPDPDFGEGGYTVVYSGPEDDLFYDVKVLADGRIVASGFSTSNGTRLLLLGYNTRDDSSFSADVTTASEPISISKLHVVEGSMQQTEQDEAADGIEVQELKLFDSFDEFVEPSSTLSLEQDTLIPDAGVVYSFIADFIDGVATFMIGEAHAEDLDAADAVNFFNQLLQLEEDTTGYALAVTEDGQIIVVGTSTDTEGQESIAAAKFISSPEATEEPTEFDDDTASAFVTTLPVSDITRTGALTGGNIASGLGSVSSRGVVFSITPYPVYKGDDGDDSGDNGGNEFTVTITAPTSETIIEDSISLEVTTSEAATCKYEKDENVPFNSMTGVLSGSISHSATISDYTDGATPTYYVRCQNSDGDEGSSFVTFTVDLAAMSIAPDILKMAAHFVLPEAHAEDGSSPNFLNGNDEEEFVEEGQTEDGSGSGNYGSILKNLKPGTVFYVRAYAIANGKVHYGNRIRFQTADSCFIATASFGSIFHPYVKTLREFRDVYLTPSPLGHAMVELYYQVSPPVADIVASHSGVRLFVQVLLLPLVAIAWLFLHFGLVDVTLWTVSFLLVVWFFKKTMMHRRVA